MIANTPARANNTGMPVSEPKHFRSSLRDLFILVGVLCILLAMLVPAIYAARESGRRTNCINNLKQLGLSMHNHHDTFKYLPPGETGESTNEYGWAIYVYPFVESSDLSWQLTGGKLLPRQGPVLDAHQNACRTTDLRLDVCQNVTWNYPPNAANDHRYAPELHGKVIIATRVPVFLCPSSVLPTHDNDDYGASHFCGNAGWEFDDFSCGGFTGDKQNGMLVFSNDDRFTHVVRFDQVTDGLSNTLMIGEVTASQDVSRSKTDHGCFPIWAGGNNDGAAKAGTSAAACDWRIVTSNSIERLVANRIYRSAARIRAS